MSFPLSRPLACTLFSRRSLLNALMWRYLTGLGSPAGPQEMVKQPVPKRTPSLLSINQSSAMFRTCNFLASEALHVQSAVLFGPDWTPNIVMHLIIDTFVGQGYRSRLLPVSLTCFCLFSPLFLFPSDSAWAITYISSPYLCHLVCSILRLCSDQGCEKKSVLLPKQVQLHQRQYSEGCSH